MDSKYIEKAKALVLSALEGHDAEAYLFGSSARGEDDRASDIDIAVLPKGPMPMSVMPAIRSALEESDIPYFADVIDLSSTSADFRDAVIKEGIRWK